MQKVAIVTDSVACIPRELIEKYDIEVVPIQLIFGEKAYRDGIDISPTEFYALLRQAEKLPTTAGAVPGAHLEAYRNASQRANNILCITVTAKLSGMFNAAQQAMEIAKEELPNVVIELLDSETAAAAEGFVALAAARAAASGKSLSEVIETAKRVIPQMNFFAALDTLYYLVKGGRAPKIGALAASLLKIKPVITIKEGEVHPAGNPRATDGAMKHMLKIMDEKVVKGQPLHVAVSHADDLKNAVKLRDEVSSRFDCAELLITEFTPVMGAHTGPGVIGVAFYSE